jgi:3-hydroxyisobutyrate dehydrogenase-like beta-hydroxyacid dehydrogenase
VRQTLKDANLMLEQARKTRQPLPLLEVHADVLQACVRADEGDCDNSEKVTPTCRQQQPSVTGGR